MHIHQFRVRGCTYYEVRESYRCDGKCKHRTVSLGTCPTVEAAFEEAWGRYLAGRKGRRSDPFTDDDRKRWARVCRLEQVLRKNPGSDYQRTEALKAENQKWARHARRIKQGEDAAFYEDFVIEIEAEEARVLAILGLEPGASGDEIRAARDRKARECHPDQGGSDEAMAAVNEAYERLTG